MQIDPAALSRTDSASNGVQSSKTVAAAAAASQKSTKALISVPRLELESVYTDLKAAIGDNWGEYKQSTTLFLLGKLCHSLLLLAISLANCTLFIEFY